MKKNLIMATLFAVTSLGAVSAQTPEENPLSAAVEQLQSDNEIAQRLKVTGYVQMQYQKADTAGVATKAGGDFGSGIDNRFTVRRGRVKFAYTYENSLAVMQFDITEKGLGIKDAYLTLTEPLYNTLSLTGGVFDRPFGYEISYSSSARETPERSRVFQTLFPGERDLGAKLTLQAPKTSRWNFLKLDVGLFNGNGTNVETDSYKDLIAHFSATKATKDEKIKWGIGASYYKGGYSMTKTKVYSMKDVSGVQAFTSEASKVGDRSDREYFGIDGQLSCDWAAGISQIRAEYLTGKQPGVAGNNSSLTAAVGGEVFNRNFNGYYVYFIQNILESPLQAVVKFDVYDPNTDVSGNQIGQTVAGGVATNSSDIKYSTLGLGLNYRFNSNVKIMAYYDMVKNETTSKLAAASTLTDLSKDRKDNVLTLRVQYKF